MTPFEEAQAVYLREPCARPFQQDLMLHYLHGFVFSTPDYFMMGRPVMRSGRPADIVNPAHRFDWGGCDAWWIYLAAGETHRAWPIMPWPMAWFGWERKNEVRWYPVDRVKRLSIPPHDHHAPLAV